ncbi:glycoside hydrolase family 2 [Alteromonas aestuariivivens]|uniref:Glycoside hydrolase family 2 n=1 Tax=Alteromonas aestuariivivens TaxID=1938339 RepID=A0A3D8MF68_9ALTE|nr:glycoside hydrolase family 2 [Alteromonas aestuariivivens]
MADVPLATPWASDVDPGSVLGEYPRPLMQRSQWLNLNGVWQFQQAGPGDAYPQQALAETILVPFAWESALSGQRKVLNTHRAWYKRTFRVPAAWQDKRLLLHFGAVDWQAQVFVNGRFVGQHQGGFAPFSFDISDFIVVGAEQEVAVNVYDPGSAEGVALGKQANQRFADPGRYTYSPVSGIWQTVWLEPVGERYITAHRAVSDIDRQTLTVQADVDSHHGDGLRLRATAFWQGNPVAQAVGSRLDPLVLEIPQPQLWWPHSPNLYDLKLELLASDSDEVLDQFTSYFAMRKIAIEDRIRNRRSAVKVLTLNHKFVFQFGPLDQGYWPDGLYTAPTDEALRWDIEQAKNWGFNMIRKHIKVEPQRWYYWADKLGMLVWQDLPSTFKPRFESEKTQFETEIQQIIKSFWNHPSIIQWVVFNEHWGAYDVERITRNVMALDQTRLVTGNSGIDAGEPDIDYEVGHIKDNHHYRPPTNPFANNRRAVVNGEYGAIGYKISGHLWDSDGEWVHHNYAGKPEATEEYLRFIGMLNEFKHNDELSGAVYTQWTDVENEMNGLYTYDRKVEKLDHKKVREANLSLWQNDLGDSVASAPKALSEDGGPESVSN